jgi:Tfp pilus assembly protein PilP
MSAVSGFVEVLRMGPMVRMIRSIAVSLVCAGLLHAAANAQEKPAAPPPATSPSPTSGTAPGAPDASAPYSYDPGGRRDPFVSLLSRGSDPKSTSTRPAGLAGLMISEISVKGIIRDRTGFIAMVQGTGTRTYTVRAGEKLMDGTVKAITADTVVFSEDVNDPLSMVKQKEVRKTVRPADGGR